MPPNEDKKLRSGEQDKLVVREEESAIVERGELPPPDRLIGFFSSDAVDAAFKLSDFDVAEEIGIAASIARGDDDRLALSALGHLRSVARDAAKASGIIGTVSQTETSRDEHGNEVKRIASTNTIIQRLQRNQKAMEELDEDREHRSIQLGARSPNAGLHDGSSAVSGGSADVAAPGLDQPTGATGTSAGAGGPDPIHPDGVGRPVDKHHEAGGGEHRTGGTERPNPRAEGVHSDGGRPDAAGDGA